MKRIYVNINDKFFRSILSDLWCIKDVCFKMGSDVTCYKLELPKVIDSIAKIEKKIEVTLAQQREKEAKNILKKRSAELKETREKKIGTSAFNKPHFSAKINL